MKPGLNVHPKKDSKEQCEILKKKVHIIQKGLEPLRRLKKKPLDGLLINCIKRSILMLTRCTLAQVGGETFCNRL